MKISMRNFKYELNYMQFMKIPLLLLFVMIVVFCINQNKLVSGFNGKYKMFTATIDEVKRNGDDPELLMKEDYEVKETVQADGSKLTEIVNIVRYDYEELKKEYNKLQPVNSFIEVLKLSAVVVLPIIAGVFAIYAATFDASQKTLKTRSLLGNSKSIYVSKLLATITVFTAVFAIALLLGYIISVTWSSIVLKQVALPYTLDIVQVHSFLDSVLIVANTYFISLIILLLSFCLGIFFKQMTFPLFIFLIYHLMLPNLGRFDLKNVIMNLHSMAFNGDTEAMIDRFSSLSIPLLIILITGYVTIFVSTSFIRFKRMSKY